MPVCVWISVTARNTKLILKYGGRDSSIGLDKKAPK